MSSDFTISVTKSMINFLKPCVYISEFNRLNETEPAFFNYVGSLGSLYD